MSLFLRMIVSMLHVLFNLSTNSSSDLFNFLVLILSFAIISRNYIPENGTMGDYEYKLFLKKAVNNCNTAK